jgi:nitrate reductase NapAB chaperone NapD
LSILGVVVRSKPADAPGIEQRLAALPGVDIVAAPGDGRCVVVIEDSAADSAAATMAAIAQWAEVLHTALVYEYSGPDVPGGAADGVDYTQWRDSLRDWARRPTQG